MIGMFSILFWPRDGTMHVKTDEDFEERLIYS
jgi:hypothetical protein